MGVSDEISAYNSSDRQELFADMINPRRRATDRVHSRPARKMAAKHRRSARRSISTSRTKATRRRGPTMRSRLKRGAGVAF